MTHSNSSIQPSEAEMGAINAEGDAALGSLVTELLERLNRLESRLDELQEHLKKASYNRPIIVNSGFLVTFTDLFRVTINVSVPQADIELFSTWGSANGKGQSDGSGKK
jgi:hypothetical protein